MSTSNENVAELFHEYGKFWSLQFNELENPQSLTTLKFNFYFTPYCRRDQWMGIEFEHMPQGVTKLIIPHLFFPRTGNQEENRVEKFTAFLNAIPDTVRVLDLSAGDDPYLGKLEQIGSIEEVGDALLRSGKEIILGGSEFESAVKDYMVKQPMLALVKNTPFAKGVLGIIGQFLTGASPQNASKTVDNVLQSAAYNAHLCSIIDACNQYLKFINDNCKNHRIFGGRFTLLSHGSGGRKRVMELLGVMRSNAPYHVLRSKVIEAYQSSNTKPSSFSRFLERAFLQGKNRPASQSKQEFIDNYLLAVSPGDEMQRVNPEVRETKRQTAVPVSWFHETKRQEPQPTPHPRIGL